MAEGLTDRFTVDGSFQEVLKNGKTIGLVVGAACAGRAVESLLELVFRVVVGAMSGENNLVVRRNH